MFGSVGAGADGFPRYSIGCLVVLTTLQELSQQNRFDIVEDGLSSVFSSCSFSVWMSCSNYRGEMEVLSAGGQRATGEWIFSP